MTMGWWFPSTPPPPDGVMHASMPIHAPSTQGVLCHAWLVCSFVLLLHRLVFSVLVFLHSSVLAHSFLVAAFNTLVLPVVCPSRLNGTFGRDSFLAFGQPTRWAGGGGGGGPAHFKPP